MLHLGVEREIEEENKVLGEYNLRQTVCIVIAALLAMLMYLIFHNWILMVVFTAPFALVLLFFAKPGENGEKAEEVIMKAAERHYYKNQTRCYRTKNRYMPLMNGEYRRMSAEEKRDARKAKKLKEAERRRTRRRRRSEKRGFA